MLSGLLPTFFTLTDATTAATAAPAAGSPHASEMLLVSVLLQLAVIIGAARIMAVLVRRIGQPAVVGEILAGLMLGPSLLGWLRPDWFHSVFTDDVVPIFKIIKELGLVLLLFLIGLEFDFSHLKQRGAAAVAISISGIVTPFLLGCGLALATYDTLGPADPKLKLGFTLFMGVSMAITAMPVLGRILIELNLTRSRLGTLAITAAAVNDALGWTLLAAITALVRSEFSVNNMLLMIGETLVMAAVMIFIVRPVMLRLIAGTMKRNGGELSLPMITVVLIAMMLAAIATAEIGIFAIFGAFLLGAVLAGDEKFREAMTGRMSDFVTTFFVPIFFAYTGLLTDIGSLQGSAMWLMLLAVLATAVLGKFGGCTLAAKLGGLDWRQSTCIGVLMNTRGLMELIVINVGYQLGVVPKPLFCMLVIMALTTTIMTTPLMLLLGRRDAELRPFLAQSSFKNWIT